MTVGADLFTIGQLAQLTGVQSRTIRFWSDNGVVAPVTRSPSGYRLYGIEAVARIDLIRTLRDLGLGLEAVRQVLSRQLALAEVAEVHVRALDAEIRTLRLRRAVLSTVAKRASTAEEISLMHKLTQLSAQERQKIVDSFVGEVFAGVEDEDAAVVAEWMRELPAHLPDDPTPGQVDAWIELAELVADKQFGRKLRRMALGDNRLEFGLNIRPAVLAHAGQAVREGIAPESEQGRVVLDRIVPADFPAAEVAPLTDWLEMVADQQVERCWQLLSLVNEQVPGEPAVLSDGCSTPCARTAELPSVSYQVRPASRVQLRQQLRGHLPGAAAVRAVVGDGAQHARRARLAGHVPDHPEQETHRRDRGWVQRPGMVVAYCDDQPAYGDRGIFIRRGRGQISCGASGFRRPVPHRPRQCVPIRVHRATLLAKGAVPTTSFACRTESVRATRAAESSTPSSSTPGTDTCTTPSTRTKACSTSSTCPPVPPRHERAAGVRGAAVSSVVAGSSAAECASGSRTSPRPGERGWRDRLFRRIVHRKRPEKHRRGR
ncbi:MerR family transcriptional regulator [Amycolatopsis circi]|uniref:helix-turn-helix domain-containing protein n=1 Tax=Amycolatopsis circi TaxID=871959 RepID=UPI001FC9AC04|nr:MerR family transcriptional regulator [Amycolatopsis circi]